MVFIFIKCTKSFGIYDNYRSFSLGVGRTVKYFLPEPKTFSAWLDRGSYLEAFKMLFLRGNLFKKKFVQQVGFAGSVLAADRHDPNLLLGQLV